MALLVGNTADVNSNLVQGTGTQSATYVVPANIAVKLESVVATIANAAATSVRPELTIRDQSGVVIARARQGSTIPAGDDGTAAWSLRLGGEGVGEITWEDVGTTAESAAGIQFDTYPQDGNYLYVSSDSFSDSAVGAGIELVDAGGAGVYLAANEGGIRLYTLDNTGEITLQSRNDLRLFTIDNGGTITVDSDGPLTLGGTNITIDGSSVVVIDVTGGNLRFTGLPTSAPGASDAVWNDSGVLKIT